MGTQGDPHGQRGMQHISPFDVEIHLSQMLAEDQNSRTQQQGTQAEHLSQVLYNDTATHSVILPSSGNSVLSSQKKHYGVLELGTTILHQLRRATATPPQTNTAAQESSLLPAHNFSCRSFSTGKLQEQPVVSLRGGAEFQVSWVALALVHVCWDTPFNTGSLYRSYFDSLSETAALTFCHVFGNDASCEPPELEQRRRLFYRNLIREDQQKFLDMIHERVKALLGPQYDGAPYSYQQVLRLRTMSKEGDEYPLVRLRCLLSATLATHDVLPAAPIPTTLGPYSVARLQRAAAAR